MAAPCESVRTAIERRSSLLPSSAIVDPDDANRLAFRNRSRLPLTSPPSTSVILSSSAHTAAHGGRAETSNWPQRERQQDLESNRPLFEVTDSLVVDEHAAPVFANEVRSSASQKGKAGPSWPPGVQGSPTPRQRRHVDVFAADGRSFKTVNIDLASSAANSPADLRQVGRSGSIIEDGSLTAVGRHVPLPIQPAILKTTLCADVSIEESTADSASVAGLSQRPALVIARNGGAFAPSPSLDSFSGGMSFPPEVADALPNDSDGAEPMEDDIEDSVDGPLSQPETTVDACRSRQAPLTTEEAVQAVLDEPLILALSSGDHDPEPIQPSAQSLPPLGHVPLTRDLGWRHETLGQASGVADHARRSNL